jgi:4-amino-4-deoxy-L-arabinose transferase-like glycosyltransferase
MTLILLLAAVFRLVALTSVPPGMTHDEADHGVTAQAILDGARDIYFTVGYGREPLYDYATAVVMAAVGETIFSARLTAVFFSLILIAGTYAWTRQAFDAPTALLTAAGLAVSFWPVMAGRQALRSITLPALFVLAVYLFWRGLQMTARPTRRVTNVGTFPLAGLLLGLTAYTYIPARVLWLVFPVVVVYRMITTRSRQVRLWALTGLMLLVALAVAAPLLLHLNANPGLEVRVAELSAPLSAAAAGDYGPLWANATSSLRLFFVEGDPTWRYNVPGRPWLGPVMGGLFLVGVGWAMWLAGRGLRRGEAGIERGTAAFFALVWLLGGLSPALVTGPALSMTQAIGLLPVLYLFPALAVVAGGRWLGGRLPAEQRDVARLAATGLAVVAVALGGWRTARDYFGRWANEPEMRVQYESAMVTALNYINRNGRGDIAVSTVAPGPFHTPAIAALTVDNPDVSLRWFDGRQSLLLPDGGGTVVIPGFTPIPGTLSGYLADSELITTLPWQPGDRDYRTQLLAVPGEVPNLMTTAELPASFGLAADLIGFDLPTAHLPPEEAQGRLTITAGDTLSLVTGWRLRQPLADAMLFAQLVGPDGVVAQADRLGAPGALWSPGDLLLQDLSFTVPPGTPPGTYALITGLYRTADGRRLLTDGSDHIQLSEVEVVAP